MYIHRADRHVIYANSKGSGFQGQDTTRDKCVPEINTTVELLNNGHIGTDHFVDSLSSFRGKIYCHYKVRKCPLLGVPLIRGSHND